jgi:phosphoribosylformylglycinamidine cyclo-ligase
MVVDDIVAVGARPLFMNDYLAVGRLDPQRVAALVGGIADACVVAGCALVGGETAEHPGLLEPDEFDIAGFAVGVVEREDLLGPHRVRPGDALIALPSSGPHSNGYSLIRRIVDGLDLAEAYGLGQPLAEALLEPTRIHTPDVLALVEALGPSLHAAAHITGGGVPGNVVRVLPAATEAVIDQSSWRVPAIFGWLAQRGPVVDEELRRTLNCGIGMVVIVDPSVVSESLELLRARGTTAWVVGEVLPTTARRPSVRYIGDADSMRSTTSSSRSG